VKARVQVVVFGGHVCEIVLSLVVHPPSIAPPSPWRAASPLPGLSWRGLVGFGVLYAAAPVIGFALLVALFRIGLLGQVSILFYRGLALIALAFVATFAALFVAVRRGPIAGVRGRDAFSAAVLSLAFNLCFLVIFPVTIDRSISVFVLGEMAAHADRAYSSDQMAKVFADVYVGEDEQIDRRLREQLASGNVERVGGGYRISAHGQAFIQTSKLIAWMFDGDTRFVSPASASVPSAAPSSFAKAQASAIPGPQNGGSHGDSRRPDLR
jgi:hypothetical protein